MVFLKELQWRGVIYNVTEGLQELLAKHRVTGYIGFDPTAPSLHVGSLLPIVQLMRFQQHGHRPIVVVGGATALIGDPSGKDTERPLLTKRQVEENLESIKGQLRKFLDFDAPDNPAMILNNADWLLQYRLLDFLRDVGKHFTVNYMLSKESVKRRLSSPMGISFTEFSYLLLQAYDFLYLYDRYGCVLQMGGSDQWGNITAGIELIRKLRGAEAHGLVFPLVTTSSGKKFGKTERGTIWLDREKTSPFKFYQFWLNVDDADVIKYLKYFTFLNQEEIAELEVSLRKFPERRDAQRALAYEVTRLVHGEVEAKHAERASRMLFGTEPLRAEELVRLSGDVPTSHIPRSRFEGGISVVDLAVESGLASSRSEARRLIQQGGLYLNNERITEDIRVTMEHTLDGLCLLLRKGRKTYHLIVLVE